MKKLLIILSSVLFLSACSTQPPAEAQPSVVAEEEKIAEYREISGEEAAEMMTGDVIILDVRTQEEFDEGHIENAILLPHDQIKELAPELLPDKDATILVYCRTGGRSNSASNALVELGYTGVYDFGGITTDWEGEVVTS